MRWEGAWRELSCLTRTTAFAVREQSGPSLKSAIRVCSNDLRYVVSKLLLYAAFSALMQLVGHQEGHLACKKLSGGVLAWLSVWNKVQTCIRPS